MHSYFFLKMQSHSLWDWMSQSAMQVTLSLSEDSQNNSLTDLSLETVKFDEKLLRRNNLTEALKHWRAQDWWS